MAAILAACVVMATPVATRQLPSESAAPSSTSELRDLVQRVSLDRAALGRRYPIDAAPERFARLQTFYREWETRIESVAFDPLSVEGRVDHVLLRSRLAYDRRLLDREQRQVSDAAALLPFGKTITDLADARMRMQTLDPEVAAATLEKLARDVTALNRRVMAESKTQNQAVAQRAQELLGPLTTALRDWRNFYNGYDPMFSWWTSAPYTRATKALDEYRKTLRETVLGIRGDEDEPIVGRPIGRDALVADLASEFIAYVPEDLLAVAEREFAWCEAEMKKAARDMGFGDDWKAALEKVKTLHVPPGRQPDLIRDLAREAEDYVERNNLVTVPPLAKEVWRMQMMSPERQLVNPFFTGGEVISVSFPTDTMDHDDKLMSMRGNNIHFARATVFHELIPGHHLQGFMNARYNSHRNAFDTPFWREGWSLYWEMLLWDRGFQQSPENRIGMLFWRMHRAARIIFSLRFHLGEWTPAQCIQLLVDRVGHEPANAEAEVRRSFNGSYPPLYQLAYMMGGLQFRALHAELVERGRMTDRQFHDRVLMSGAMPVEMVRAVLTDQKLPRNYRASWKYADTK
jgi:uncharacterized protein (DUF885 family)